MVSATQKAQASEVEKVVQEMLASPGRPVDIKQFKVELGEDSSGEPAIWVWLDVAPDAQSKGQVSVLRNFGDALRDTVIAKGVSLWPYVRFREAA